MTSYIREQSIGVKNGLSSYPVPPPRHLPAPARPRPARRPPPPPLTHTQSPPYRGGLGDKCKKNMLQGESNPHPYFIRTYVRTYRYCPYRSVRTVRYVPGRVKVKLPTFPKRSKISRNQTDSQTDRLTDRQRTHRRKGPRTSNILTKVRI